MEATQTESKDPLEGLTALEQSFIGFYCQYQNAAKAARLAGYSAKSAKEIGYQTLNKPHVSAAISILLEKQGMSVGECIGRMTAWGRGSMDPFLTRRGELTLTSAEAVENRHLIKKVRQKKTIRTLPGGLAEEEIQTEIELHDAKDAVDKMLQIHGKYKLPIEDPSQQKEPVVIEMGDGVTIQLKGVKIS